MESRAVRAVLGALLLFAPPSAADQSVVVPATAAGYYDDDGDRNLEPISHTTGEYPPYYEDRSFVTFDLSRVSGTVTGGTLHIQFSGKSSPDPTETVELREVTTPVPELLEGGTGLVGIFDDLADGALLGSHEVVSELVVQQIPLAAAAIPLIQAALGGDLAIGMALSSLSGTSREMLVGCCLVPVRMLEIEGDLEVEPLEPPGGFPPGFQVIDFEFGTTSLPDDIPGITFVSTSTTGPDPWFAAIAAGQGRIFGAQYLGNLYNGSYSDLGIEFDPPVHVVGGWIRNVPVFPNEAQSVQHLRISAYAPSGTLLEQRVVDLPAADEPPTFEGFSDPLGIARITWSSDDVGHFGVDDVVYAELAPVQVPLLSPAWWGALVCALCVFGGQGVRRRSAPPGGANEIGV